VIDGTRTRDNRNHNPGLYQLSYDHRCVSGGNDRYADGARLATGNLNEFAIGGCDDSVDRRTGIVAPTMILRILDFAFGPTVAVAEITPDSDGGVA